MSFSDSDSSSYGGDYKNFKQITRDRLLHEMLRSCKTGDSKSTWKVLIMDKLTVKIMSYACKMADITDEGVSCKNQEGFAWKVFVFVCFAMLSAVCSIYSIVSAVNRVLRYLNIQ